MIEIFLATPFIAVAPTYSPRYRVYMLLFLFSFPFSHRLEHLLTLSIHGRVITTHPRVVISKSCRCFNPAPSILETFPGSKNGGRLLTRPRKRPLSSFGDEREKIRDFPLFPSSIFFFFFRALSYFNSVFPFFSFLTLFTRLQ